MNKIFFFVMIILILAILVPIVWTRTYVYMRDTRRRWRLQDEADNFEIARRNREEMKFLTGNDSFKSVSEEFDEVGRKMDSDWEKAGRLYDKSIKDAPKK